MSHSSGCSKLRGTRDTRGTRESGHRHAEDADVDQDDTDDVHVQPERRGRLDGEAQDGADRDEDR